MARYTTLGPAELEELGQCYGARFEAAAAIDGGMRNSSFRARRAGEDVVVKVLDSHGRTSAARLATVIAHVHAAGVPTPAVLPTASGELVGMVVGRPVIVKGFIDGDTSSPLGGEGLHAAGALLARIHQVAAPIGVPVGGRRLPPDWQTLAAGADDRLNGIIIAAAAEWESVGELPSGFGHGDLFRDNLVRGPGGLAVIDWEYATIDPFVLDIGIAVVGLCRTGATLHRAQVADLLAGYTTVRPIGPHERAALGSAVRYAAAVLAFHRWLHHHVRFPDPTRASHHVELVEFADAAGHLSGL